MVASVLVLGAGIMGLSTAWALARTGQTVHVVDQDPIPNPRGASVDHHRLIRHAYGDDRGYMRMVDPAFAAWDLLWAELGERLLVKTGVLALAQGESGWLAASRDAMAAHALAPAQLDAATVAARYPMLRADDLAACIRVDAGGVLLADRIVAALAARCRALGVTLETGRVVAADPDHGRLTLADGTMREGATLIVAAGPWAPRLLPALPVTPSRQIVVYLQPPARYAAAWATAPMLLDLAPDGGFYAVPPVAGTPLKLSDHRFGPAGDPDDPRHPGLAETEAVLALAWGRLRELADYQVLGARACYYDVAEGERFRVEPLGARSWVMTGFSGHGFKFGALMGLALARALTDPALAAALPAWAAGVAPAPSGLLETLT